MRKIIAAIFLFFLIINVQAVNRKQLDSIYVCIDEAMAQMSDFVAIREARIGELRRNADKAANERQLFDYTLQLYEEYKSYQNDSAIICLFNAISYASALNDKNAENYCRSLLAFQYSSSGMYTEAFMMLDMQDENQLEGKALAQYYISLSHVYGEVAYYTGQPDIKRQFEAKADSCRQNVFRTINPDDDMSLQLHEMICYANGDLEGALRLNDRRMAGLQSDDRQYAIVAFYRYLDYYLTDDTLSMEYWLTQSVLCDIRNAVTDLGALWELTHFLTKNGDVERAYQYIGFATDCANKFNSRMRNWQITSTLSHINKIYEQQRDEGNKRLKRLVISISLLSLVLLIMIIYSYRQHWQLTLAQKQLENKNKELIILNEQLSALVRKLSSVVEQLDDSNRIKEEYVGRLFYLCSNYIDRISSFRKQVIKKIKNRRYEDLYYDTKSLESNEDDIKELYNNFDTAFLNLYPDFVTEFNHLLKPEKQIHTHKNSLTTPLRIFALIRLGIEDSGKIAGFLHYSVNTIYNYRAHIKNGALCDREQFEENVKKIGMTKKANNHC